jgi:release factor glutamine methyltransferase
LARRGPVGLALATGRDLLGAAGCDTPLLDAELLLAEVLGVGRERLVIDRRELLSEPDWERFEALVARRAAREPVAYIIGRKEFRRLTLAVDPRVLIPRPETELLVDVALELPAGARVCDVGTGSGAVALAVKDERPDLIVRGFDIDSGALEVASANAERLGLDVSFARADLFDGAGYDAVLANLPYVAEGERASLAPEILDYEPAGALFAGPDGLELIRRLVGFAAGRTGLLAVEIGPEQAVAVTGLLAASGFSDVRVLHDLAGHERVVVGSA